MWYKEALRKHWMRFDPRVVLSDEINKENINPLLGSYISASIIKGLDILGLVCSDIMIAYQAKQISINQGVDLYIMCGQIYKTSDQFDIIVYNTQNNITQQLSLKDLLQYCQSNNLITLIYNLTQKKAQQVEKLKQDTGLSPTMLEIFNALSVGYMYVRNETFDVMSSGTKSLSDFKKSNIFTLIKRKKAEEMGILPPGEGIEYVPKYLQGIQK